jgi:transglutaminase-like putative cysteine protease
MRIRIGHTTRYEYDSPAKSVIQILRLTPRPFDGQHVLNWQVEVDQDARLHAGEDALGNITHTLSLAGPVKRLSAQVSGEIETTDTGGVVQGGIERFPPMVYLRETPLTRPDAELKAFAEEVKARADNDLDRLHELLNAVYNGIAFDPDPTDAGTSAVEAFSLKRGVCQDLTHIFIAAARTMGRPARYVSGHLVRTDGKVDQEAAHAWAEAHVEGLGWVGFDATNGIGPTEAYVRVAIGLDYLGAAPVRGSRYGGGQEHLHVNLHVAPAGQQVQ